MAIKNQKQTAPKIRKDLITKAAKTANNKKLLLAALEKSLGVVSLACKNTGLSSTQHYEWMAADEEYKLAVEKVREMVIDFAESKLHQNINKGDTTSIIFFLKTQGKTRGYVEKTELSHTFERPVFNGIDLNDEPLQIDEKK